MIKKRVHSIDSLRGLVIVLMSLGHARHFFYEMGYNPTDLEQTTAIDFFLRWITHICAPAFVFLAGISIHIIQTRRRKLKDVSIFLITRGLWLIFLEVTVLTFFWHGDFSQVQLQVIWVIGISFLLMAFMIYLPGALNLIIALAIIVFHNLLDLVDVATLPAGWKITMIFAHNPGQIPITENLQIDVLYSWVPYLGIMLLGYCMGFLIHISPRTRVRFLWRAGIGMILGFIALRTLNLYGDPYQWEIQAEGMMYTLMSFLKVTKYPPSLHFLLLTLGLSFMLLAVLEVGSDKRHGIMRTLGQVAMFFYIIHIPVYRLAAKAYELLFGLNPPIFVFLVIWSVVLAFLTFLSVFYAGFKASRKKDRGYWWLSYV